MRYVGDPLSRHASHAIGALVLRAVEERRYEIIPVGDQPQMEIYSARGIGVSWSVSVKAYPSDPVAAEFLRLRELFEKLASQWRKERNPLSSNAWNNVLNPAYVRIIGMGWDAVPFILRELQHELEIGEPDDWFVALWAITHETTVSIESRGNVKEMAKAWIEWGSRQGYFYDETLGAGVPEFGQVGRA
jgi:hypothetical protein